MRMLTHEDIRAGKEIYHLGVALNCRMDLSKLKLLSEPDDEGKFNALHTYGVEGKEHSYKSEGFLESIGAPCGPREYQDNYHRSFEATDSVKTVLEEIVAKQDLKRYFGLIGVNDSDKHIEALRVQREADIAKLDCIGVDIDDDDFGIGITALESYLESKRA